MSQTLTNVSPNQVPGDQSETGLLPDGLVKASADHEVLGGMELGAHHVVVDLPEAPVRQRTEDHSLEYI